MCRSLIWQHDLEIFLTHLLFLVINQNKWSTDGLPIMCNLISSFLSIPIENAIKRERERERKREKDTRMKNSVIISTLQYKQLMI